MRAWKKLFLISKNNYKISFFVKILIHDILMNKMIKGLKNKLTDTKEKKTLIENIFSLSILHGLNYILPLLTIPYLVRILGPNYFGLLAYVSSIIGIFRFDY